MRPIIVKLWADFLGSPLIKQAYPLIERRYPLIAGTPLINLPTRKAQIFEYFRETKL